MALADVCGYKSSSVGHSRVFNPVEDNSGIQAALDRSNDFEIPLNFDVSTSYILHCGWAIKGVFQWLTAAKSNACYWLRKSVSGVWCLAV